ncbi:hypothetical protein BCL76_1101 [Streptomyces sp. CG 926]|nr:hypothetical protein BCL76_1101 [Streptomyces sp. CG 926]
MAGVMQLAQRQVVIGHQHLGQPGCRGDYSRPARRVQIYLVPSRGADRILYRAVGSTETRNQLDFLLAAKALPKPGPRIVRIAEVVEKHVDGVVEVLELIRIEPHLSLPCRTGQCHDRRYDMKAVVRQSNAVIDHEPRVRIR